MDLTTMCPCCDPIVFGHAPPCPRWESAPVPFRLDFTPRTGGSEFGIAAELAALQSLVTTMQQLNDAMQPLTGNAIQFTATEAATQHRGPSEDAQD